MLNTKDRYTIPNEYIIIKIYSFIIFYKLDIIFILDEYPCIATGLYSDR
jgi:hypothetical protein